MTLTDYHARYLAHELTRRASSGSVDNLSTALADAQVDLNPRRKDDLLDDLRRKMPTYVKRLELFTVRCSVR